MAFTVIAARERKPNQFLVRHEASIQMSVCRRWPNQFGTVVAVVVIVFDHFAISQLYFRRLAHEFIRSSLLALQTNFPAGKKSTKKKERNAERE